MNAHYGYENHTIQDSQVLDAESETISNALTLWEAQQANKVRNFVLKLSDVFNPQLVRACAPILFLQRGVAFQNAGMGKPVTRITRTTKFIEILDRLSHSDFSESFSAHVGMTPTDYCRHFIPCLGYFLADRERTGFCNMFQFSFIDEKNRRKGITTDSLRRFVEQSSCFFANQSQDSFRSLVSRSLENVSDFYQPFFLNSFLDFPLIRLSSAEVCLPDPFSFTESCWNQIDRFSLSYRSRKSRGQLISSAFENYLETVLLPSLVVDRFEKIERDEDYKRADFYIETQNFYVVIECKNSVMALDTGAYFQADKIADLWYRTHIASEQISKTVKALNLSDKPTIPLVLTLYEGMAASEMFSVVAKKTDYCAQMELPIPPIVLSIHEFEQQTSGRSIDNWAQLAIAREENSSVTADNNGHSYSHLDDIPLF